MPKVINHAEPFGETDEIFQTFGTRLREARLRANLTQAELAARADLKRTYIIELESGTANITLKTLAKMADVLDMEPRDFLPESRRAPLSSTALADLHAVLARIPDLLCDWGQQEGKLLAELKALQSLRVALERTLSLGPHPNETLGPTVASKPHDDRRVGPD